MIIMESLCSSTRSLADAVHGLARIAAAAAAAAAATATATATATTAAAPATTTATSSAAATAAATTGNVTGSSRLPRVCQRHLQRRPLDQRLPPTTMWQVKPSKTQ